MSSIVFSVVANRRRINLFPPTVCLSHAVKLRAQSRKECRDRWNRRGKRVLLGYARTRLATCLPEQRKSSVNFSCAREGTRYRSAERWKNSSNINFEKASGIRMKGGSRYSKGSDGRHFSVIEGQQKLRYLHEGGENFRMHMPCLPRISMFS